ncbi:MAG: cytochrome c peroxidase [Hyphomicrobiales bacterium]
MFLPKRKATVLAGVLAVLSGLSAHSNELETLKEKYKRPLTIPFEGTTPYSPQLATLGKMLFFDPRISGAKNINCSSCHNPSFGYEVPVATAVGAANVPLKRQAPTILNMAWVKPYFWDGRAETLEEQAAGPITAEVEMNANFDEIVNTLQNISEYNGWFNKLFPNQGVKKDTIVTALATYQRTVVSGWSPFDRWVDGDDAAISKAAKRGFQLFNGKAKCADCHTGWNFTDNKFHDIGLDTDDIGRSEFEPDNTLAKYAFKTPGLRNTSYRAPFMHNGKLETLKDVMAHYISGGIDRASKSKQMTSLNLSLKEQDDVIEFLKTLTADKQETPVPILPN